MSDDRPQIDDDPAGKPEWDQAAADLLIGQYVLVGITSVAANGTVTSQEQLHGRGMKAEQNVGFPTSCEGARAGESCMLPPDPKSFHPAGPGRYTLRSTGEVVDNPD